MPDPKKPAQKPTKTSSHNKEVWREFLIGIAAHTIAPLVLAAASTTLLFLVKDPSVPPWPFFIFVALTIVLAYVSLISLQYFFHKDFILSHSLKLHLALAALFVVIVTAPLALTLSYTRIETNRLLAQVSNMGEQLDSERKAQEATNGERLNLYRGVTGSMFNLLSKQNIDSDDLNDILQYCIRSLSLDKPQYRLRATVVYLDTTGTRLVIPGRGYFGFDRDITGLNFDVSQRNPGVEDEERFRERVGVAGWSYLTGKPILDDDVQTNKTGDEWRYKPFEASGKDQADRAMICVGIPDLKGAEAKRFVGVLSISSPSADIFKQDDLAIASFFATLLGRFKTPVESPKAVQGAAQRGHEN